MPPFFTLNGLARYEFSNFAQEETLNPSIDRRGSKREIKEDKEKDLTYLFQCDTWKHI